MRADRLCRPRRGRDPLDLGRHAERLPLHPKACASARLRSADPEKPLVDANFFGEADDLRLSVAGMRFARRLLATRPLADNVARELLLAWPRRAMSGFAAFCGKTVKTNYHPVGTARMARTAIRWRCWTQAAWKVRGVAALRVIDCAAIPFIPSGNTNAIALALGDKAASLDQG
ncbi:MAG: GMC family oxidoreductase [Geminicoccaceae bacterium]